MKRFHLLSFFALLILLGQGCFSLGGGSAPQNDGGVFKTTDAGDQWRQAVTYLTPQGVQELKQLNVLALDRDPQDSAAIYLGARDGGLFYSYDAALTWQRPHNTMMRNVRVTDIDVHAEDVCTVYAVSDKRLHKTDDCSRTFDNETYIETRGRVDVTSVELDWFNTDTVWLGLSNGDVLQSRDGGDTWRTIINVESDVMDILIHQRDSRKILIATEGDGFFWTENGGEEWMQVEESLREWRRSSNGLDLAQSNNSAVVFAATDYGLLRSFDFGQSWEPLRLLTAPGDVDIGAVEVSEDDADAIFYTADSTLYRSSDGGESWTTKQIPTGRTGTSIVVDPDDPKVIYVGVASN